MRKALLTLFTATLAISAQAIEANTVEIVYNGNSVTVNMATNISSYVNVESGTSSHVRIVQDSLFAGVDKTISNEDGEIIYVLSGSTTDGEFYLEGSFKATVELNGVSIANPSGAAINIQNGKRVAVSVKKDKTNTLSDGVNEDTNGCFHCKGHVKMKGKGTLNIAGNSRHGIYCKEYLELKNLTLNITTAVKDGIHCKEYFLLESGIVSVANTQDDAIQVELSSDSPTGVTTDHEDENSGNFYMTGGTLTLSNYVGKAVKADGTITFSAGKQNFDTADIEVYAGIDDLLTTSGSQEEKIYDLMGRRIHTSHLAPRTSNPHGIYLVRKGNTTIKTFLK